VSEWWPDPTHRHQYRYWDGRTWTDHVADNGVAAIDPLPPAPPAQASASASDRMQQVKSWTDTQMRGAAAAMYRHNARRQGHEPRVLDTLQTPSVLGQWSGLASAVSNFAVNAGGLSGVRDLLPVLRALMGSSAAQAGLLEQIDAKVEALALGPYETGRTHLSEAERVGAEDETQIEHIRAAKDCFYQAHGQTLSVQSRALVEYHLGVTWLLLTRPRDAKYWLAQSHGSALTVVNELAGRTSDVQVLHSRGTTVAASYFYPAGIVVLGMKFKKMLAAEQAKQALLEYVPFVSCAAKSHNSLADDAAERLQGMQFVQTADGYNLVAVDV
jgi:hypothetical protein